MFQGNPWHEKGGEGALLGPGPGPRTQDSWHVLPENACACNHACMHAPAICLQSQSAPGVISKRTKKGDAFLGLGQKLPSSAARPCKDTSLKRDHPTPNPLTMAEQHINYDTFYPDASLEDAQRRLSGALDAATAAERLRGWLCTSGAQGMEAFIAVNNFPADAACTLWFSLREGRAKPVPASDAGQRLAVATAVMSRLGLHLNKALSQAGAEAAGVDRAPGSPSDQVGDGTPYHSSLGAT